MAISGQSGGDLSEGGKWLKEEGTYHLLITDATENPTNNKGQLLTGKLFGFTCSVAAGTVAGQENKCIDIALWDPAQSNSEDNAASSQVALDRFLVAVGIITARQARDKSPFSFEATDLIGRQLIIKFEKDAKSGYLREWKNFYHVDDPAMAKIPKNAAVLQMLPPQLRLTADQQKDLQNMEVAVVQPVAPQKYDPSAL